MKKGDTIQGRTLYQGGHYLKKIRYAYEQKRPKQLWWNRNKCDGTVDNSDTIQFILAIGHDFTLNYLN